MLTISTHYTAKQDNLLKGTSDYIGTTSQLAAAIAASKFGNPFDSYTAYDSGTSKVSAVYVSIGTAWISY